MHFKKLGSCLLILSCWPMAAAFADETPDPCVGILNLVNRPTISNTACAVPFEKGLIETGGQYMNLMGGKTGYNVPQIDLRLGLPAKNELSISAPNFNHQTTHPHAGWGPTTIGLKHELGYNAKWLGGVQALVTLPSGSKAFGSNGTGGTINGIVTYSIASSWSVLGMLGVSTQTLSSGAGGQRYNSVNPYLVLTWQPTDKFQSYAEVYGQSKTAPRNGAGFNCDAGILYAWTTNLETDLEYGQRISGKLGGFNNYLGAGLAWLF